MEASNKLFQEKSAEVDALTEQLRWLLNPTLRDGGGMQ